MSCGQLVAPNSVTIQAGPPGWVGEAIAGRSDCRTPGSAPLVGARVTSVGFPVTGLRAPQ